MKDEPKLVTETPSDSVIGEFMRLDTVIRDCEHALRIAERLKARNRWQARWDAELAEVREKLEKAIRARDWLDAAIARVADAPTPPLQSQKTGVAAAARELRPHCELTCYEIETSIARHCVGAERLAEAQQKVNLLRNNCAWAVELLDESGKSCPRFDVPRSHLEGLRAAWHATQ